MIKKYLDKCSLLIIIMLLIMAPCMVFAEEDGTATPSPTETPSTSPSTTPEPTTTPTSSPEIVATGITIKQGDTITMVEGENKTFGVTITPDNTTNKEVVWSSSDSKVATVSDDGKVTAVKAGTATITVKMKDNASVKATCLVTVTAKSLSSDATLKSLTVENGTLDKKFDSKTEEYTVTVPKSVKELELDYKLNDSNAKALVANNDGIITGTKVKIVVTAEDKTTKTYILIVKKEETNLNLKSLQVKGYTLNESFSASKTDYTVDIPFEAVDVTVLANAEDDGAKVSIKGATGLKVGSNTVTITVTSDGNTKTYKLVVNRGAEDETETTSGNSSKYTSVTSSETSKVVTSVVENDTPDHTLRYVFVTIGSIVLFAIGGIGIYFFIKTAPKKDKKNKGKGKEEKVTEIEKNIDKSKQLDEKASENNTLKSIMPGDLEETREFRVDDLNNDKKNAKVAEDVESLFEDE